MSTGYKIKINNEYKDIDEVYEGVELSDTPISESIDFVNSPYKTLKYYFWKNSDVTKYIKFKTINWVNAVTPLLKCYQNQRQFIKEHYSGMYGIETVGGEPVTPTSYFQFYPVLKNYAPCLQNKGTVPTIRLEIGGKQNGDSLHILIHQGQYRVQSTSGSVITDWTNLDYNVYYGVVVAAGGAGGGTGDERIAWYQGIGGGGGGGGACVIEIDTLKGTSDSRYIHIVTGAGTYGKGGPSYVWVDESTSFKEWDSISSSQKVCKAGGGYAGGMAYESSSSAAGGAGGGKQSNEDKDEVVNGDDAKEIAVCHVAYIGTDGRKGRPWGSGVSPFADGPIKPSDASLSYQVNAKYNDYAFDSLPSKWGYVGGAGGSSVLYRGAYNCAPGENPGRDDVVMKGGDSNTVALGAGRNGRVVNAIVSSDQSGLPGYSGGLQLYY